MSFGGSTKGFLDTKSFRRCILTRANQRLGVVVRTLSDGNGTQVNKNEGLLSLLDSTYKSDVPSTTYAMHLKSIAFESARFLCMNDKVKDDLIFVSTRGEFLSQNIASFLFPNNRFSQTDSTDGKVRNFYLSIIEAYFGGSTKSNIEQSLLRFLEGVPTELVERFLLAREDPSLDDVVNKFTFDINVDVNDERVTDVNKIQEDVEFLLNIIKPAHTTFQTKLIFSEFFDIYRKGCTLVKDENDDPLISHDGFEIKIKQANTAICDTFHMDYHQYFYEDLRKPCGLQSLSYLEDEIVQKEDITNVEEDIHQASPRLPNSTIGGQWTTAETDIFHAKRGPFGKVTGELADSVDDITVKVNGVEVTVTEIFPLSGAFRLATIPDSTDTLTVSYYLLRNYIGPFITNDYDSVTNNWNNVAVEFNYKSVISPAEFDTTTPDVLETQYKYKGFDLFNSSVLNCAESLNLNELGLRGKLNDYHVFKSFDYDNSYHTTLNEDTPLYPISRDKKDVWARLPFQQFRMNNDEFLMNTGEDRMFGDVHYESYHPFFAALEIESEDNGGITGALSTICEDDVDGFRISLDFFIEEDLPRLGTDHECTLYTNATVSGFTNQEECVMTDGLASWDFEDYSYQFSGKTGQMHMLLDQKFEETIPSLTDSDTITDDTHLAYNLGPFTLNNFDMINDQVFWLDDPDKAFNLTFQTNHSILGPDIDEKGISPGSTSSITGILNVTKGFAVYDLTNMTILGDKVIQLDETIPANISIGIDLGDVVIVTYTAIHKMNDNTELVRLIRTPEEEKFLTEYPVFNVSDITNETQASSYDLTGYDLIGDKIIKLDTTLSGNQSIGFSLTDDYTADYTTPNINNEVLTATKVDGDFLKFKVMTGGSIQEILRVTNLTKDLSYDLTDIEILGNNILRLTQSIQNILIGYSEGDEIEVELLSLGDISFDTSFNRAFNKLLVKLDNDTGINKETFSQCLGLCCRKNLSDLIAAFNRLLIELNDDTGTTTNDYDTLHLEDNATYEDFILHFNLLLCKLDHDTGVTDTDYEKLCSINIPKIILPYMYGLLQKLDDDIGVSDDNYYNKIWTFTEDSVTKLVFSYNKLLEKLDNDPGVDDTDYFSELSVNLYGDYLIQNFNKLLYKLDNDTGVDEWDYQESWKIIFTSAICQPREKFNDLLYKLDDDIGVDDFDYVNALYAGPLTTKLEMWSKFNDLLNKLDNDAGVDDTDYLSSLVIFDFDSFVENFNDLLTKLDNDTGVAETDYNSFTMLLVHEMIDFFNSALTKLDNDTGVDDTNYMTLALNDAITLEEYLTAFSDLLNKLDNDAGVDDTDYFYDLQTYSAEAIVSNFNGLLIKLDSDTGVDDTDYFSLISVTGEVVGEILANLVGSIDSEIAILDEAVEIVRTPLDFKYVNLRLSKEIIYLNNITKDADYLLTDQSKIIASSGQESARNALITGYNTLEDNLYNKWESIVSNDTITETLTITFNRPRDIELVNLIDFNWKEYEIKYEENGQYVDFSTPINELNNTETNKVHQFSRVTVSKLYIAVASTQIPDQQKFIHKIITQLKDIIEIDSTLVENQRIGLNYGDIVYSESNSIPEEGNIEPPLSTPVSYSRSYFQIYPV